MVEIRTERLLLRSYLPEDAKRIAEIANNKKIARNMVETFPFPYTLEKAKDWVKIAGADPKNQSNFVVIFDGEIIGGAGFDLKSDQDGSAASGGYWFGEDYWGNGFGTEVWTALRDYAFEKFDVQKMTASVYSWNLASARIQEKCGFSKVGCISNSIVRFGDVCDEMEYCITREEWEKLKASTISSSK